MVCFWNYWIGLLQEACVFDAWTSKHATSFPRNVYTSYRKQMSGLEYDDDDDFMMTNDVRRKQFLFMFFSLRFFFGEKRNS